MDDWVVADVVSYLDDKISKLSKVAYGIDNSGVARAAFKEQAKILKSSKNSQN